MQATLITLHTLTPQSLAPSPHMAAAYLKKHTRHSLKLMIYTVLHCPTGHANCPTGHANVLNIILLTQCPAEHTQAVPSDQGTSWQILYLEPTAERGKEGEAEEREEEEEGGGGGGGRGGGRRRREEEEEKEEEKEEEEKEEEKRRGKQMVFS